MSVFFSVDLYLVFLRQSFSLNLELTVLTGPSNPRDLPILPSCHWGYRCAHHRF